MAKVISKDSEAMRHRMRQATAEVARECAPTPFHQGDSIARKENIRPITKNPDGTVTIGPRPKDVTHG